MSTCLCILIQWLVGEREIVADIRLPMRDFGSWGAWLPKVQARGSQAVAKKKTSLRTPYHRVLC